MAVTDPILVTGATGNVGRHVVRRLLEEGRAVRALTRDPARADLPEGAEAVRGDLAEPAGLESALAGVAAVFLVWPSVQADAAAPETIPAIAAHARRAVYLSARGADADGAEQQGGILGSHAMVERLIRECGMSWTFLRAGGFATNLLPWVEEIRDTGAVRSAFPDLARPLIHEADIAEVAVRALTGEGHSGAAYEITGPEALTQAEQARIIGEELGRPMRFETATAEEEARGYIAGGLPPEFAEQIVQAHARMSEYPESATTTFTEVTGQAPRTFRQWAADHVGFGAGRRRFPG